MTEDLKDLTIDDYFILGMAALCAKADVSDFKDGEIWSLKPKNPFKLKDRQQWDGQIAKQPPIVGDFGMNKDRKLFVWTGKTWLPR